MSNLSNLCEEKGVKAKAVYGNKSADTGKLEEWQRAAQPWTVTLRYQGRRLTVEFWQGQAHTEPPTAADVLSCLITDTDCGEREFEEFCSDLGYDPDSRKAESTWKACAKTAVKVRRLLGDDFDEFAVAEH